MESFPSAFLLGRGNWHVSCCGCGRNDLGDRNGDYGAAVMDSIGHPAVYVLAAVALELHYTALKRPKNGIESVLVRNSKSDSMITFVAASCGWIKVLSITARS